MLAPIFSCGKRESHQPSVPALISNVENTWAIWHPLGRFRLLGEVKHLSVIDELLVAPLVWNSEIWDAISATTVVLDLDEPAYYWLFCWVHSLLRRFDSRLDGDGLPCRNRDGTL